MEEAVATKRVRVRKYPSGWEKRQRSKEARKAEKTRRKQKGKGKEAEARAWANYNRSAKGKRRAKRWNDKRYSLRHES